MQNKLSNEMQFNVMQCNVVIAMQLNACKPIRTECEEICYILGLFGLCNFFFQNDEKVFLSVQG